MPNLLRVYHLQHLLRVLLSCLSHDGTKSSMFPCCVIHTVCSLNISTLCCLRRACIFSQEVLIDGKKKGEDQESLEEGNVFSPTRHLLLTLKRLWQLDRVHGLPAVTAPAFFPSASKGEECWWGTQDSSTVFLWD
jgi:hypothetical protein